VVPFFLKIFTVHAQKYVNAFLNSDGGVLFHGISDSGRVIGLPFDRKMKDMVRVRMDAAINAFRPQVDPDLWRLRFLPVIPRADDDGEDDTTGEETAEGDCKEKEDTDSDSGSDSSSSDTAPSPPPKIVIDKPSTANGTLKVPASAPV
jgi:hypothetical protein